MSVINIEQQGRRFYLRGDTYPLREQLRAAGANWDASARCWWTGSREKAEAIVVSATGTTAVGGEPGDAKQGETLADDSTVVGRGRYKGREYLVVWTGTTRRGEVAKLAFLDGTNIFWASRAEVEVTKTYQARQVRGRSYPMTFGRLRQLREEFADQRQAEREADQIVGAEGPYCSRFSASRGNRLPSESIGSATWLRHAGQRVAVVLVGYYSASYLRSEDAEDMGEYGLESGWYGTTYYRAATRPEYDALQASSPRQDGVCVEPAADSTSSSTTATSVTT